MQTRWNAAYQAVEKDARREAVGVISDAGVLQRYLSQGYQLVNYDEDGCSLFSPPLSGGGLAKFVSKELADKSPRPATPYDRQRQF